MNRVISFIIVMIASTVFSAQSTLPIQTQSGATDHALTGQTSSAMPLPFTKNMGQWPDSILFRASGNGATMWFTKNGIWYQFFKRIDRVDSLGQNSRAGRSGLHPELVEGSIGGPDRSPDSIVTTMIKAEFVGASESVEVIGEGELEYKCNYFIGNQPEKWRTDVPNYSAVTMRGIYPGVDISFTSERGMLIEEARAIQSENLSQVRVEYRGAEGVQAEVDNCATVQTKFGEHRFAGVMLADDAMARQERQVAATAPGASGVRLVYSTYLGGNGFDNGFSITVDGTGCAYVVGKTVSSNFPMQNPLQDSGGYSDAFVTKISSSGGGLIYSSYLGGNSSDASLGIEIDDSGSAFVSGYTSSSNFPTQNHYQTQQGSVDVFVSKLSSSGNALVYSTYLGGVGEEYGHGITVDAGGNAYVTGTTASVNFPVQNALQTSIGGANDAFITKLDIVGSGLIYSTYLGGSGNERSDGIAVDAGGNAYVIGQTSSLNFPTQYPFQSLNGGMSDAFVSKLNGTGSALIYSTYLGGSKDESASDFEYFGGWGIAIDREGSAYVAGRTASANFPTKNPFQDTINGLSDAFVTKLSGTGSVLVYSTYLGGSGSEICRGIAVDHKGSAYAYGQTTSINFPTRSPFQVTNGGGADNFVTKLNIGGSGIIYSTYLGGSAHDYGDGKIVVDSSGNAYITGTTASTDFPTEDPFQGSFGGDFYDAFVSKIETSISYECVDLTGNVDCDFGDGVDISDLSALIDYLYISFIPLLCPPEANTDGQPGIDISDLSALIDYLYISFTPPAACQ